ncbi:IclR family transcriptional regulator [Rhizobium halophytocola]|uniref:DNA-binding IclR family transcriptional regulator n=1 Tax=Rhizobium halophytocola TaxID=735519 RepID=A0ABS4E517_9HYPH|nr:DNA-binding IclR family transcriptional regulator [Rhizobium halophytocola]
MNDQADKGLDRYRAPALDKGLDILELLADAPKGLTRSELVKAMGRSPSEIYRMLERLVARSYVARSPEGDRYELTMKLFVLAHRHTPVRRIVSQATPLMDAFARRTHQSCQLVISEHGTATVVAQASPPDLWEFKVRVGAELDPLTTSSGLTLLAFQEPERRQQTLAVWRGGEMAARLQAVEAELETIRAQGYRIGESQQLRGLKDISTPIIDQNGEALAVITCPFTERLDLPELSDPQDVLRQLREMAESLSLR